MLQPGLGVEQAPPGKAKLPVAPAVGAVPDQLPESLQAPGVTVPAPLQVDVGAVAMAAGAAASAPAVARAPIRARLRPEREMGAVRRLPENCST